MRTVIRTLAALAFLALLAGGAVVGFGLHNVSARAGHWPITVWVLHTIYRRSVDMRAPAPGTAPPLTEDMARLCARHFDRTCRMCHGAPGETRTWTTQSMEPVPPPIVRAVRDWSPEELHWIVHNGAKMRGMPHWPSIREDDIWAVVAFLNRVRGHLRGMDGRAASARRSPAGAPPGLANCAGCHRLHGRSANPHIPRLDLQSEAYLAQALQSFRDRRCESGIMAQVASAVPEEALPVLAAWFASVPPASGAARVDAALAGQGEALAWAATRDPEIPACTGCEDDIAALAADHAGLEAEAEWR